MMLAYRFVRLIESHADVLTENLLRRVSQSTLMRNYDKVPPGELKQRVREMYVHMGEWLLDKGELDIEQRYAEIGKRRAQQGVPLSQVIWAVVLVKENLWEFIRDESIPDRPVEVFSELEFLRLLEQFFDRAICATASGYEKEITARGEECELKEVIARHT